MDGAIATSTANGVIGSTREQKKGGVESTLDLRQKETRSREMEQLFRETDTWLGNVPFTRSKLAGRAGEVDRLCGGVADNAVKAVGDDVKKIDSAVAGTIAAHTKTEEQSALSSKYSKLQTTEEKKQFLHELVKTAARQDFVAHYEKTFHTNLSERIEKAWSDPHQSGHAGTKFAAQYYLSGCNMDEANALLQQCLQPSIYRAPQEAAISTVKLLCQNGHQAELDAAFQKYSPGPQEGAFLRYVGGIQASADNKAGLADAYLSKPNSMGDVKANRFALQFLHIAQDQWMTKTDFMNCVKAAGAVSEDGKVTDPKTLDSAIKLFDTLYARNFTHQDSYVGKGKANWQEALYYSAGMTTPEAASAVAMVDDAKAQIAAQLAAAQPPPAQSAPKITPPANATAAAAAPAEKTAEPAQRKIDMQPAILCAIAGDDSFAAFAAYAAHQFKTGQTEIRAGKWLELRTNAAAQIADEKVSPQERTEARAKLLKEMDFACDAAGNVTGTNDVAKEDLRKLQAEYNLNGKLAAR